MAVEAWVVVDPPTMTIVGGGYGWDIEDPGPASLWVPPELAGTYGLGEAPAAIAAGLLMREVDAITAGYHRPPPPVLDDTDSDGTPDWLDPAPDDPSIPAPDTDGDGWPDDIDPAPDDPTIPSPG
jgi:hypothetical protein